MEQGHIDEYANQAHQLVDDVIESAMGKLKNELWLRDKTKEAINSDLSRNNTIIYKEPKYEDYEVQNIKWLTIEEFSPDKAEGKINEFIKVCK
jgi:hypothetical protein